MSNYTPEPVAKILVNDEGFVVDVVRKLTPLLAGFHDVYAAPPRREWVSLTDEQITGIVKQAAHGSAIKRDGSTSVRIARAIDAARRNHE